MPHRNRVTPAGDLIVTPHRGSMYGNRGVLHNDDLTLVRRHQVRRWLVCVLEFRGRQRKIMQPRRYTELFFHDEAVALAAGHRPCAECRYRAYLDFREAWTLAHGLSEPPKADAMDVVLHSQRGLIDGVRTTHKALLADLPDGVFIVWRNGFWLLYEQELHRWTSAGYSEREDLFTDPADVLTPLSTVATLWAGYRPVVDLREGHRAGGE